VNNLGRAAGEAIPLGREAPFVMRVGKGEASLKKD
jgi:hypothetical protein